MVNTQRPEDTTEAQEPDVEAHAAVRDALKDEDTEGHGYVRG
jgi:hypothetical protein